MPPHDAAPPPSFPSPPAPDPRPDPDDDAPLRRVQALLRERTGHDFSQYKQGTIVRRIERRMRVRGMRDLHAYRMLLDEDRDEAERLLQDLLIGVTSFFRDRDEFEALQRVALPPLFHGKGPADELRAWTAACSTGEEAYSLAMLLHERAAAMAAPPALQLFATDVDRRAIAAARAGAYPAAQADDIPPALLRRYALRDGAQLRIQPALRDAVLFAEHDLLRDPPFSRLDLISCRNLLIYLDREAHRQVLATFHVALKPGGYLFLGSAETADAAADLFAPVDARHRLYQARAVARSAAIVPAAVPAAPPRAAAQPAATIDAPRARAGAWADVHRRAASRAAPPSILVDAGNDILHIDGDAGRYLRYAGGEPTRDVVALVTPELRLALRAALFQVRQGGHPAVTAPVRIGGGDRSGNAGGNGAARALAIAVQALDAADAGGTTGLLLLQFFETEAAPAPDGAREHQPDGRHAAMLLHLEDELRFARRKLQDTMDHADTAVHDARLANEWLRSTVAELQSSLEDQQRRHEELQSLNEEQVTVNAQLRSKVEDTSKAHDDLSNLIASTDIATIFLDREMRILRYTPRIGEIFNVIPGDVGRPLAHLASRLAYPRLVADIDGVLQSAQPVEREVDGREGHCYIVRIHPYRTNEDHISGAVMTCFDISGRRAAERALRRSDERHRAELEQQVAARTAELERSRDLLRATMDASIDMIQVFEAVRDGGGRIVDFRWVLNNHTSESRYGEVRGQSLLERNPGVVEEGIFAAFCQVIETGEPLQSERHYVHEQFDSWFLQSVVKLGDGVATTTKDIGDWKRAQAELLRLRDEVAGARLQESQQALHSSEARHAFLLTLSDALRPLDAPEDIVYTAAQVLGEHLGSDRAYYVNIDEERQEFVVERDWHRPGETSHARRYPLSAWTMPWLADGRPWVVADVDTDPILPDAQRTSYRGNGIRAAIVVPLIKDGRLVATFCTNQRLPRAWTPTEVGLIGDTAERIWATIERAKAKAALRDTSERLSLLLQSMGEGVIGIAPDRRCMFINDAAAAMLGVRPDELVGRCARALLGEGRVLAAMTEGAAVRVEDEALRCADGTPVRVSCQVSPMVLGGNPAGAVVVFRRAGERRTARPG